VLSFVECVTALTGPDNVSSHPGRLYRSATPAGRGWDLKVGRPLPRRESTDIRNSSFG
jgi:hypothetical protein